METNCTFTAFYSTFGEYQKNAIKKCSFHTANNVQNINVVPVYEIALTEFRKHKPAALAKLGK